MRNENSKRFTDPQVLVRLKEVEQSSEYQKNLETIKASMTSNNTNYNRYFILGIVISVVLFLFLRAIAILIIIFGSKYYLRWVNSFKTENQMSYKDNFLMPILRESFPDIEFNYDSGIEKSMLEKATPRTDYYCRSCHIIFGDDTNTEFCNLYSYHEEKDSDDHYYTVTDFKGQVFRAKYDTGLMGHVRILPLKKGLFGKKYHEGYAKKQKDETKIELEDIVFNEKYAVYCTDEISSRILLNPYMLVLLDDWAEKVPVTIYMDEENVVISFYTKRQIFNVPESIEEINNLSLTSEYKKIQDGLHNTYSFLDTINQQI